MCLEDRGENSVSIEGTILEEPPGVMKLGDNMATVEACNVWGDVCPRKTRPPRIGEIPRHVAVDEESPGSSSHLPGASHSLKSLIDASSGGPDVTAQQNAKNSPTLQKKLTTVIDVRVTPKGVTNVDRRLLGVSAPEVPYTSHQSSVISTILSVRDKLSATLGDVACAEGVNSKIKWHSYFGQSTSSIDFPEESRKDSAVCLDEDTLPSLPRKDESVEEDIHVRYLGKFRPRRESSGYSSNLSTFDEDRRNSDALLPLRRSSKRFARLREDELDRMPTTEIYRKSSVGIEMPNIEELKEIRESLQDFKELTKLDGFGEVQLPRERRRSSKKLIFDKFEDEELCKRIGGIGVEMPDINEDGEWVTAEVNNYGTITSDVRVPKTEEAICSQDSQKSQRLSQTENRPEESPRARHRKRITHQFSSPSSSAVELERIPEKLCEGFTDIREEKKTIIVVNAAESSEERNDDEKRLEIHRRALPKSIKVYQLLSTQSEDRGDEPRLLDRRTSLQISRQEDEPGTLACPEDKLLLHADSVPLLKIPQSEQVEPPVLARRLSPVRKLSTPGDVGMTQRLGDAVGIRPIYPYCQYSPYGSPQGSPRTRRRPLRESRRVSIDNRQGALQLNQYKLLDNIGQGSFGIVKLAYNEEDETHYAMKILSKKKLMKKAGIFGRMAPGRKGASNPLAKVYREIALLKKLDHPNVVKLVEVLDDPDEDNLYLVFELVQKGEVLQLPTDKPLDEETARKNFRDVVMGVEYLHYQRIVHRDIKPSNLLVDSEGRVKVADLGVSAELRASGELLSGLAGTPAFAAPETTTPGAQYSGTLCDVWSMGVTLYSLVTGRVPWDGSGSIIGVQAAVRSEPLRFPDKPTLSDDLRDLLSRMLAKDPAMRLALEEIKSHEWLTNHGNEPLPSEVDNCRLPVTVTDEEVARVVTRVPKLDTLILIKTMLKQHSFQNPFLPRRIVKSSGTGDAVPSCLKNPVSGNGEKTPKEPMRSRVEQFHRAGRSNSAPDSYEWQTNGRQVSSDTSLPPLAEASIPDLEIDKR